MYKNRKPLIIGILCTLIVMMAVGFALFSSELTITGTSSIDSNWNIRITNIRVKNVVSAYASGSNASGDVSGNTGCTPNNVSGCTTTMANFETKLITPGDSVTYEVTITNNGNLDGVVSGITLSPTTTSSDAIQVSKSGLAEGDTISHTSPNNTNTIEVTVTYNSNTSTQPSSTTSNISLQVNYQQDLSNSPGGQGGQEEPAQYTSYDAGDIITFAGSDWRVIKDSTTSEDYVTLLKEEHLNVSEIGSSYVSYYGSGEGRRDWNADAAENNAIPLMAYYWSSTCWLDPIYNGTYVSYGYDIYGDTSLGYSASSPFNLIEMNGSDDRSGCTNSYSGSKVKIVLDNYMNNTLGVNNLKSVNVGGTGYKIRLITMDEILNLTGNAFELDEESDNYPIYALTDEEEIPEWFSDMIHDDYNNGEGDFDFPYTYSEDTPDYYMPYLLTMTPVSGESGLIYANFYGDGGYFAGFGVDEPATIRPVINLLKTAIPAQS